MPTTAHKASHRTTKGAHAKAAAARKSRSQNSEASQEKAFLTALDAANTYFQAFVPTLPQGAFSETLAKVADLDAKLQPILDNYDIGTVVTWCGQELQSEAIALGEQDPNAGGQVGSPDGADDLDSLMAALMGGDPDSIEL